MGYVYVLCYLLPCQDGRGMLNAGCGRARDVLVFVQYHIPMGDIAYQENCVRWRFAFGIRISYYSCIFSYFYIRVYGSFRTLEFSTRYTAYATAVQVAQRSGGAGFTAALAFDGCKAL